MRRAGELRHRTSTDRQHRRLQRRNRRRSIRHGQRSCGERTVRGRWHFYEHQSRRQSVRQPGRKGLVYQRDDCDFRDKYEHDCAQDAETHNEDFEKHVGKSQEATLEQPCQQRVARRQSDELLPLRRLTGRWIAISERDANSFSTLRLARSANRGCTGAQSQLIL